MSRSEIVALDASPLRVGIAMAPLDWDGDVSRVRTVLVSRSPQSKDPREETLRKKQFAELVWEHVLPDRVSHLYIEGQAYAASNSRARDIAANHFALLLQATAVTCAPIVEVPAPSARKLLTGRGNATKTEVWEALIAFGFSRQISLDESDALAVLNSAMNDLGGYTLSAIGYEGERRPGNDVVGKQSSREDHPKAKDPRPRRRGDRKKKGQ